MSDRRKYRDAIHRLGENTGKCTPGHDSESAFFEIHQLSRQNYRKGFSRIGTLALHCSDGQRARRRAYDLSLHALMGRRYLIRMKVICLRYMYSWFGSTDRSDTISEPRSVSASFSRRAVILKGCLAKVEFSL